MSRQSIVHTLVVAATAFEMELGEGRSADPMQLGGLERGTALSELARLGVRPDVLRQARALLEPEEHPVAVELLGTAAFWAVFAGDD